MIGRMYQKDGYFAADMNSIASMTGLQRRAVGRHLAELIENDVLRKTSEYRYTEHMATEYFMPRLVENHPQSTTIPNEGSTVGEMYVQSYKLMERLYKRPPRRKQHSS